MQKEVPLMLGSPLTCRSWQFPAINDFTTKPVNAPLRPILRSDLLGPFLRNSS